MNPEQWQQAREVHQREPKLPRINSEETTSAQQENVAWKVHLPPECFRK
jgi:hypothetical protein